MMKSNTVVQQTRPVMSFNSVIQRFRPVTLSNNFVRQTGCRFSGLFWQCLIQTLYLVVIVLPLLEIRL